MPNLTGFTDPLRLAQNGTRLEDLLCSVHRETCAYRTRSKTRVVRQIVFSSIPTRVTFFLFPLPSPCLSALVTATFSLFVPALLGLAFRQPAQRFPSFICDLCKTSFAFRHVFRP